MSFILIIVLSFGCELLSQHHHPKNPIDVNLILICLRCSSFLCLMKLSSAYLFSLFVFFFVSLISLPFLFVNLSICISSVQLSHSWNVQLIRWRKNTRSTHETSALNPGLTHLHSINNKKKKNHSSLHCGRRWQAPDQSNLFFFFSSFLLAFFFFSSPVSSLSKSFRLLLV